MGKEYKSSRMEIFIKDCTKLESLQDLENTTGQMAVILKEFLQTA